MINKEMVRFHRVSPVTRVGSMLARRPAQTTMTTRRTQSFKSRKPKIPPSTSRSFTRTTRKRRLNEKIRPDGPVSESYFKFFLKSSGGLPRGFKKALGNQTFITNQSNNMDWGAGKQLQLTIGVYQGYDDLSTMLSDAAGLINETSTVKNWKIFLKNMTAKILLTNQTNDVAHTTIYDIVTRKDCTKSSYYDPLLAWIQGNIDSNSANAEDLPGSTPFQSRAFCNIFKIVKVTDVMMHSGGHHVHTVNIRPKITFDEERVLETGSHAIFGGLTCFSLIVAHGFPINDTAGTTNTTAAGKIDYVLTKTYGYEILAGLNAGVYVSNNISTTPAQQNLINDLTGAATTITEV